MEQRGQPSWVAACGAFSLIGRIILLATSTWVWWLAAGDVIMALVGGKVAGLLLGLYVVVPFGIAVVFSVIGLVVELLASNPAASAGGDDGAAVRARRYRKRRKADAVDCIGNWNLDQERSEQDDSSHFAPVDPDAVQAHLTVATFVPGLPRRPGHDGVCLPP